MASALRPPEDRSGAAPARVRSVFERALDLTASARAPYLDRACRGRPELRRAVERLLAADDRTAGAGLLAACEAAVPATPAGGPSGLDLCGARLGEYRLRRLLARGGMGSVYEAEQRSPRRAVALKVLNAHVPSARDRRRLQFEAEVLARLQHPGIAQVYAAGVHRVESGGDPASELPYIAMELVEDARDLVAFARERRLSTPERLGLLLRVCEAVHYGHSRGVVHCDLKPGNVLVDRRGRPRVIDFGIARLVRGELERERTRTGEVAGTLAYMSPEQLEARPGAVGVRTDVYALGLLLCELVCGRLPYRFGRSGHRSLAEVLRAVRELPPVLPTQRNPRLPRELDWIAARALEKDPRRRYSSAGALAEDLRRLRRNEPLAAGPRSRAYALSRFVRRHRVAVSAAAAVFAALVAGLAMMAAGLVRAERSLRSESALRRVAEERESEALAARRRAEELASFLEGVLRAPSPRVDGRDVRVVELLDPWADRIDAAELSSDLEAAQREALGAAYRGIGLHGPSERQLRAALELRRASLGAGHLDTLRTALRLAQTLERAARLEQAEALAREARAGLARAVPEDHPDRLWAEALLGIVLHRRGRLAEAEPLFAAVLERSRAAPPGREESLAAAASGLGLVLLGRGRPAEAERLFREALAVRRAALGPDHYEVLAVENNLALAFLATRDYERARALCAELEPRCLELCGERDALTLGVRANRAAALYRLGEAAEAEELLRSTLAAAGDVVDARDPNRLTWEGNLGLLLLESHRIEEALTVLERTTALQAEVLGPESPPALTTAGALAAALCATGRADEAAPLTASLSRALAPGSGREEERLFLVQWLSELGFELSRAGRPEAGAAVLQLAADPGLLAADAPAEFALVVKNDLALALEFLGRREEAERLYAEILAEATPILGAEHPSVLAVADNRGETLRQLGRAAEAEALYAELAERSRAARGPHDPSTLQAERNLAWALAAQSRFEAAADLYESLADRFACELSEDHWLPWATRLDHGQCLRAMGAFERAEEELLRARDGLERLLGDAHPSARKAARELELLYRHGPPAELGPPVAPG